MVVLPQPVFFDFLSVDLYDAHLGGAVGDLCVCVCVCVLYVCIYFLCVGDLGECINKERATASITPASPSHVQIRPIPPTHAYTHVQKDKDKPLY